MKKVLFILSIGIFLVSCKEQVKVKSASTTSEPSVATNLNLPYSPAYVADWNNNVSDADLQTVMNSYKYWQDNNMPDLGKTMADSVSLDMSTGVHKWLSNADLMKMWNLYRDSLKSVKIVMQSWNKMYSPTKKEAYIVTWYDETDTYKNGKVDSATYHDINQLKNGKISWFSQYKRPMIAAK
jgi:hypothetical protein